MSSCVEPLSINDPVFDRIPETPTPKRRFARALAAEGFAARTWRAEQCGWVRGNKCVNGHITLEGWNCDARFCPPCARFRVKSYFDDRKELLKYLTEAGISRKPCDKCGYYHSSEEFFYAEVEAKVAHADLKQFSRSIRKHVNRAVFRKTGSSGHNGWTHILRYDEATSTLTFRILFLSPRLTKIAPEWVNTLWPDAKVIATVFPIRQLEHVFSFRLLDLTLLDPLTPEQRARQERLLDGVRLFRGSDKSTDQLGHLRDAGELSVLDPTPKTDNYPPDAYPTLPKNCKCRKCNAPIVARTEFMHEAELRKAVESNLPTVFRKMMVPAPMTC